jgi:hypothetical protein
MVDGAAATAAAVHSISVGWLNFMIAKKEPVDSKTRCRYIRMNARRSDSLINIAFATADHLSILRRVLS